MRVRSEHVANGRTRVPVPSEWTDLTTLLGRPEWHEQAACRGAGNAVFYLTKGTPLLLAGIHAEAKAMCARCPVTAECLAEGDAHSTHYGRWGGKSVPERRKARKAQREDAA